jgi:hypothetical protein
MNDRAHAIPSGIMTMAETKLHGNEPYPGFTLHDLAAEAERQLPPVLKVMRETGLTEAGYKTALAEQMPAVDWDPVDVSSAVRERLVLAREMVRDRVALLTAPDALIGYGHAVIRLLGDPDVGSVSAGALDGTGWELC